MKKEGEERECSWRLLPLLLTVFEENRCSFEDFRRKIQMF